MKSTCMKMLAFFLLCASCMESTSAEDELKATAGMCPEGQTAYGTSSDIHCYFPSFKDGKAAVGNKNWLDARNYCKDLSEKYPTYKYDLVSLKNEDEYNFILNTEWSKVYKKWKAQFGIWVGLNDRDKEGTWTWSDGSPLDYANPNPTAHTPPWRKGEPSQPDGDEDCVRTYGFEGLTDIDCNKKMAFICEGQKGWCQIGKGEDYTGSASRTKLGNTCQHWQNETVHNHMDTKYKHNFCRNPDGGDGVWCYTTSKEERWGYCDVPLCGPKIISKAYINVKNDGSKEYRQKVQRLLPLLLDVNQITQEQIGVAYEVTHSEKYNNYPLALRTGTDIKTVRIKQQTININGTVNKKIGKRSYHSAKYRPTGLYAKPGDIITVTIPQQLVGKIRADIGHDKPIEFQLKKSTQKIGSPFGGLIVIVLEDIDATTKQGQFNIEIGNAIQAPYFVLGENTNDEWNNAMKKNAAPWAVLRIPGQLHIYIEIKNIEKEKDMEAILGRWKKTMDLLDEFLGIPVDIKPGEEQLHFRPGVGGGYRSGVCKGGAHSTVGAYYYPGFPTGGFHVAYHEFGHGYCYRDLPNMGSQMWADTVAQYMERISGNSMYAGELGRKHAIEDHDYPPMEKEYWNFNLLYTMVSFSKFSKGKACGNYKAPSCKGFCRSYTVTSYYNCWTELYQLPVWEFGWQILGKVISADGTETGSYTSDTDRLVDLYCKATKRNLIPLFQFFNIKVSKSIADECEKHELPDKITKYIKIANCIKNENINQCTKLPGFPEHKGICTFDGVCNKNPDDNNQLTTMNNEFDLLGGVMSGDFKTGVRYTGQIEGNCLARAGEMWNWCRNEMNQKITATFSPKTGTGVASSSYTYPPPGGCQTGKGEDYTGSASRTKHGYTCQHWQNETLRNHQDTKYKHNFCRNPDGGKGVWCYTTSKEERWDYCDVPVCGTVGR